MAFIHKHNSSGKTYTFYSDEIISTEKNIFTVLVGKNGSGKSRLLNSLVMRGIEERKYVLAFLTLCIINSLSLITIKLLVIYATQTIRIY